MGPNEGLAFIKARFIMYQTEWDYWMEDLSHGSSARWMTNFTQSKLAPLADQIDLIRAEEEIGPGIYAVFAPGHTVDHMVLDIVSEGQHLLYVADFFCTQSMLNIQTGFLKWIRNDLKLKLARRRS